MRFWLSSGLLTGVLIGGPVSCIRAQDNNSRQDPASVKGSPANSDQDKVVSEKEIRSTSDGFVDKLQWPEPRRQELLRNEFKELPTTLLVDRERSAVLEMSRGQGILDNALVKKYVNSYASELTKHANIAVMLGQESTARNQRVMDDATGRLLQPLLEPVTPANLAFRREYVNALIAQAPTLLNGHLLTRTFYMVVLSRTGSEDLVPVYIDQLADPQQTYMVKLLASVGLSNLAQNGKRPPDASSRAIPAAKAIADFLRVGSGEAPWPVICRNLEALGSLRQSASNPLSGRADIADPAFFLLSGQEADPQVRIWAGWALSRLQYPSSVRDVNFDLLAYELAQTAGFLGDQVTRVPLKGDQVARNQRMVAKYTESLLRILEAFTGTSEIRSSGLTPLSGDSAYVRGYEQRVRALASLSLQLSQAAGTQIEASRKSLSESVSDLKTYLDQNQPKSRFFYAGGPEIASPEPEVGGQASNSTKGEASGAR